MKIIQLIAAPKIDIGDGNIQYQFQIDNPDKTLDAVIYFAICDNGSIRPITYSNHKLKINNGVMIELPGKDFMYFGKFS